MMPMKLKDIPFMGRIGEERVRVVGEKERKRAGARHLQLRRK